MRGPLLALTLVSILAAACADDDPDIGVDSNAICDCETPNASEISYDNMTSGLSAITIQAALDELAARPAGLADTHGRVTLEEMTTTSPSSGTDYAITVGCPGTAPNRAVALGGSCEGGSTGVSLQSTELQAGAFTCIWNKPDGQAIEFTAKVTCLAKAQ